ncbi:MAG: hypothetical protein F6J87_27200 [Spirulina sp. SIO3F2]|nr:hypothetical protein [Spirulina sp. SIO3F2]
MINNIPLNEQELAQQMGLTPSEQQSSSPFDQIQQIDEHGNEFWSARDLMPLLGYKQWRRFKDVIEVARENLETATTSTLEHFLPLEAKSQGRPSLDYKLSRLAAYHIALCCDSRGNEQVKLAKHYFAVKTREAETASNEPQPQERDIFYYINAAKEIAAADLSPQVRKELEATMIQDLRAMRSEDEPTPKAKRSAKRKQSQLDGPSAKQIILEYFSQHPGERFKNTTIQQKLGLNINTVRKSTNQLADKGLILRAAKLGQPAIYWVEVECKQLVGKSAPISMIKDVERG